MGTKSHFSLAHEEIKAKSPASPSPSPHPSPSASASASASSGPSMMHDPPPLIAAANHVTAANHEINCKINSKINKYEGRNNSLVRLVRMTGSGDLFAIPHPLKKTGYKCRNAYGHTPVFQDETTNHVFQTNVFKNTPEVLQKKKLMPYHPNAPCNRSPETYKNCVGTRHNDCRNASYLSLYDGVPKHLRTPKTTNQLFMYYKLDTVGNGNHSIFADKAKRMHRLQLDG